jgi:hypothetical protein
MSASTSQHSSIFHPLQPGFVSSEDGGKDICLSLSSSTVCDVWAKQKAFIDLSALARDVYPNFDPLKSSTSAANINFSHLVQSVEQFDQWVLVSSGVLNPNGTTHWDGYIAAFLTAAGCGSSSVRFFQLRHYSLVSISIYTT